METRSDQKTISEMWRQANCDERRRMCARIFFGIVGWLLVAASIIAMAGPNGFFLMVGWIFVKLSNLPYRDVA